MLSRGCANRLAIRCSFASPGACSRRPGRLRSRPAYAKACSNFATHCRHHCSIRQLRNDALQSAQVPISARSEEHTSELQSLMRISYAVFSLKQTTNKKDTHIYTLH